MDVFCGQAYWGGFGSQGYIDDLFPDFCATSELALSSIVAADANQTILTPCPESRRFAIFTRRPICGNGIVQAGEACDDTNLDERDGCISTCEAYDPLQSEDCAAIAQQAPNAPAGVYDISPDGVTVQMRYCSMIPGASCMHPIDVPRSAFEPATCAEGTPCRIATITDSDIHANTAREYGAGIHSGILKRKHSVGAPS